MDSVVPLHELGIGKDVKTARGFRRQRKKKVDGTPLNFYIPSLKSRVYRPGRDQSRKGEDT